MLLFKKIAIRMGLLDTLKSLFSEKKQLETINLPFHQIDVFVSQHSDILKNTEQKSNQFRQTLNDRFKKIKILLEQLKRAEPSPGIKHSKLCIVAKSIRDSFCENAIRSIISLPDSIQELYIKSQEAFEVLNMDMRKADILTTVFRNEMTEYSKALVELKKELNVLKKFVKRDLEVIRKHDLLKDIVEKTRDVKKKIIKAKDELSKIKEELNFLSSKKQNIANQLKELNEAKNSPEVQELDRESKELENKNKLICSEIDDKFSELKRLLKKLDYFIGQKKYSANQRKIREYIKSPSQALLADYKLDILDILSELKRAINKDIIIEEKQQKNILQLIDSLTANYFKNKQEEHKVNYNFLQENYSQKTQILTPLVFKERALEREEKNISRSLEQIQKEYDKQERILAKFKEELDSRYKQLSALISEVTSFPVQIKD